MALGASAAHVRAEDRFRPRANRLGLWLFIASESFLFGALITTRYYLGADRPDDLNQPLALIITIVLLLSSISAYSAEVSMAHNDRRAFFRYIWITIGLGLVFMGGVVLEWKEALEFFPPETLFGSSFFLLIGTHAFHVLTGLIAIGVIVNLARKGHYGADNSWAVEGVIKYWHFVDLAWVVIYPTLYLI